MSDDKTIYVVSKWRQCDGEDVFEIGMITTDHDKAYAFAIKHSMPVHFIEDGSEWPSVM